MMVCTMIKHGGDLHKDPTLLWYLNFIDMGTFGVGIKVKIKMILYVCICYITFITENLREGATEEQGGSWSLIW